MKTGPRHARKKEIRRASALLRAGLTVTAAGAALAAAGGGAVAAEPNRAQTPVGSLDTSMLNDPAGTTGTALDHSAAGAVGPVKNLQLDPLANTGVDPVDNSAGTKVADFREISTADATGPVARGASLDELPVVGDVSKVAPG